MGAVQDSVDDHDTDHDNQQDDHVAGVGVGGELRGDVTLVALHIGVKEKDVDDENDLNGGDVHVEISPWLLLLDQREESRHEWVLVDHPFDQLEQIEFAFGFLCISVIYVVLGLHRVVAARLALTALTVESVFLFMLPNQSVKVLGHFDLLDKFVAWHGEHVFHRNIGPIFERTGARGDVRAEHLFVILGQVDSLPVKVDVSMIELDVQSLLVGELPDHTLSLLLGLAKDLETVSEKTLFKSLVAIEGHVKDTSQHLLLNVHQSRKENENFGEVEHERVSKVLRV